MALEITHLDEHKVNGILDGSIDFSLRRTGQEITAKIGSWVGRSAIAPACARDMRAATYELLARYREEHRKVFSRAAA